MKNIKKLLSILLFCFLFIVLVPAYVMGCSEMPADIKWTFQNGAAPEGYNTNYLKGCSTTNVYNDMSTYAPGGGYQGATDIWAVYDVPISVTGTYKLYVNFGSSSMGETDISKALGADFTVTVGGTWDSQTQSYTGGTVAFASHEVKGGLWATKSNEDINCKSVEVGYLTLTKGTNTIKLDIKSSNSFRIASQSFRLEYCVAPDIKWTFQNGSSLEGYNANYLKGYSTTNEFNMSTYAPGGGYKGATDIWAVYEIPVVVPGTYKFYAKFGSSNSMTPSNMSEAQPADFKVTVGGTWDSGTYTGGNVAFSNSGVIGGIWGTLATAETNCKSVALGYITLDEGINTIKLDIKSSTHFRIASQSFKLEYCEAPQYSNCTVDGNNVQNNELPLNTDNITINYTEDIVLDDAVCSFKDSKNNDIFTELKKTTLDNKVIVSIREPLNAEETYTLSMSGIKAPDGTSIDDFAQEFTVDGDTVLASEQTIEMRGLKLEGNTLTVLGIVKNSLGDLYKGKSVIISIKEPDSYTYETTDIYDISDESGAVTLLYTIPDGKHRGEYGVKLVMGDTESVGQIVDTTPEDIKWTFQNGNSSSHEGYNTTYLRQYSTEHGFNMTDYAPGGGYNGATDIYAVYDVPVSVSGTYKLYVNFGSSSMGETDISKALGADFTVTVGGTVAFANPGVKGGIWATTANENTNCISVPVGYLTLAAGTNTIELDIKSYESLSFSRESFRLEYCGAPNEAIIELTDEQGNNISGIVNGRINATVWLNDNDNYNMVIFAIYEKNGDITELYKIDVLDIRDGIAKGYIDDIDVNSSSEYFAKMFLWNKASCFGIYKQFESVYRNFYIQSGATGGDGSKSKPFGTIEEAQAAVRNVRENMNGDIVINIAPGEYELEDTLEFTNEDAGKNGYRVIYKGSSPINKPIVSGGTHVTGWQQHENGLWKAALTDVEDVRQLYIDGNPARRSRTKYDYYADENFDAPLTDSWIDGLYVKKRNFPVMSNEEDLEFVSINDWLAHRTPIADIVDADEERWLIEFEQPYFSNFELTNENFRPNAGLRFYVENAYELTDEPGEFYFNKETKEIFYYPYPEEDMTKIDAVVGRTEYMVLAEGNSRENKMEGLSFENLDFRYGTWLDVNRTGIQATQADCLVPAEGNPYTNYKSGRTLPGQLQFKNAKDIVIKNCNFQNLGSAGIQMMDYVEDSIIEGNTIKDISGTSIMIGGWKTQPELNELKLPSDLCQSITIKNNVIQRVGIEFYGSPGMAVYYARNIKVTHNHIQDVPYSGISIGWGWANNMDPINLNVSDIVFSNNKVMNTSTVCRDGGFIYTLGMVANSFIENNYMENSQDYGGIYFDSGSGGFTVRNNVIKNAQNWCFLSAPESHNGINVYNNYTDKECDDELKDISNGGSIEQAIIVADATWTGEALDIVNNAGVEPSYKHLLQKVEYPHWRTQELQFVPLYDQFESDYTYVIGADEYTDFYVGSKDNPAHFPTLFMVAPTIGNLSRTEWLEYDVYFKHSGNYDFEITYSSALGSPSVCEVYLDETEVISSTQTPDTGDWDYYIPKTLGRFYATEGPHKIKFRVTNGGYFITWLKMFNVDSGNDPMFDDGF